MVFVNRKWYGARFDVVSDPEGRNKTVKFVDGDVLEARDNEIPECTFTKEAKAEDA